MWPVVGHDRVVSYIERGLKNGALSHAYFFTGPKHIGKMTLALALAQAVNCSAQDKPCGECSACLKIAARNHPDVQVIKPLTADESEDKKAKSEIIISQVRELQRWASLPPYEGRCRVFIFEEAELLNEAAANCLLKSLEEPLPGVLFILVAPSPGAVPETIASRAHHLAFRPVPTSETENLLMSRGQLPDKAALLARLSGGATGWAIAAAEHEDIMTRRTERLELLLGLIGQGYDRRFEAAEELSGKETRGRGDTAELIHDWQILWRDLLLAGAGQAEAIVNLDYKDRIVDLSGRLGPANIRTFVTALTKAGELVGHNVNPKLILETLMLDMPLVDKARSKR